MAKRRTRSNDSGSTSPGSGADSPGDSGGGYSFGPSPEGQPGEGTGAMIVVFKEDAEEAGMKMLAGASGVKAMVSSADFKAGAINAEEAQTAGGVYFDKLGLAAITDPDVVSEMSVMATDESSPILACVPELICYATCGDNWGSSESASGGPISPDYLEGFRDAADAMLRRARGGAGDQSSESALRPAPCYSDTAALTWGLDAVRAAVSRFTGAGIKVAVLDTGMDLQHPDFRGRRIVSQSFVAGQPVQDGHGHGTHCVGVSCGPAHSVGGRRYGIAFAADIFVGKVLSNAGSGGDIGILNGINWAVTNGCHVISMSLGQRSCVVRPINPAYEQAGQRALQAGTLIVAAAGNDSTRPGQICPVSVPANSTTISAVAAVNRCLAIAPFSNGGINPQGGGIDVAGPGVDCYSSWTGGGYRTISGTSMATPHAAGVAALLAQARRIRGGALGQALAATARRLPLQSRDVGAGLVQAP